MLVELLLYITGTVMIMNIGLFFLWLNQLQKQVSRLELNFELTKQSRDTELDRLTHQVQSLRRDMDAVSGKTNK